MFLAAEVKQDFVDTSFLKIVKKWITEERRLTFDVLDDQEKCKIWACNARDIANCWAYLVRYGDVNIMTSRQLEDSWEDIAKVSDSFLHYEEWKSKHAIMNLKLMIDRAINEFCEAQGWKGWK